VLADLNTHNMPIALPEGYPEQLFLLGLAPDTELEELLEQHGEQAEEIERKHRTRLRRIEDWDDYIPLNFLPYYCS